MSPWLSVLCGVLVLVAAAYLLYVPAAGVAAGPVPGARDARCADEGRRAVPLDRKAAVQGIRRRSVAFDVLARLCAGLRAEQRGGRGADPGGVHDRGLVAVEPGPDPVPALGQRAAHDDLVPDQHQPAALLGPGAAVLSLADDRHHRPAGGDADDGAGVGRGDAARVVLACAAGCGGHRYRR
ncbi:hypothetical protein G6F50_015158 [Rhizopus delemar]|uniref:Uncharacterized protein n=1 Tax=Rhizopus delemar TaxID=936053 RepID=A0A9P6XZS9_9FUNG|nr:hypothetical protein G6F50_015158 [Rhizopus delemar]